MEKSFKERIKDNELYEETLSLARTFITKVEELKKVSRDINSFNPENNTEDQFLSLKFQETDLAWHRQQLEDHEPTDILELSYLLGCLFRNVAHENMNMKGLVAFQNQDQVDFCISGSFSVKQLGTFFLHHKELLYLENKK